MNKIKTIVCSVMLFFLLPAICLAGPEIPEGFWNAPVSYTGYVSGYGKDLTPDMLFRKAKYRNIKKEDGTLITSAVTECSIKHNVVTVTVDICKNSKTMLRMVAKLVYNPQQGTNYIDSVFIKNFDTGEQLKYSNTGADDQLTEYNVQSMGQVVGAFWTIMQIAVDTDSLEALIDKPDVSSAERNNTSDNE